MKRKTGKQKAKDGRGKGHLDQYVPWIWTRESGSDGVRSLLRDWKHKRSIHTLSLNEACIYYLIRWNDNVIDVREQFPLDRDLTDAIASANHLRKPAASDKDERMSTDFLVDYIDDKGKLRHHAVSVKDNKDDLLNGSQRVLERLAIEKKYWKLKGVDYSIVFGSEINQVKATNISLVTDHYDLDSIHSKQDLICSLIANGLLTEDMERPLDFPRLVSKYLDTPEKVRTAVAQLKKCKQWQPGLQDIRYQLEKLTKTDPVSI